MILPFQALNGQKDFHITVYDQAINQLASMSEEDALKKLLDKFYSDVARQIYAPLEYKIYSHSYKWTNSNEHPMTIIDYSIFSPSGGNWYCALGTVVSKGIVYSIYYITPSFPSSKEELNEALYCLRSFYDIPRQSATYESSVGTEAISFFKRYHEAITNKEFEFAFNCLSPQLQRELGGFDKFFEGFITTVSSRVQSAEVLSVQGNTVEINYILKAEDFGESKNADIVEQRFSGKAVLSKNSGTWKIIDNWARRL